MKIEIWFDFHQIDNYYSYQNFLEGLNSFIYGNKCQIVFKSFLSDVNDEYLYLHRLIHFARREVFELLDFVAKVFYNHFELKVDFKNFANILAFCQDYGLDEKVVAQALESEKYDNILQAHYEHAGLKKIKSAPEYRFMFNINLKGLISAAEFRQALIKMYEKDSNTEYCEEDDCFRTKK